ncbi:LppU/SCO3897 family protein [Plantactinospora alkalitolerans]|uniref:LppU/SCO3897 family protein n=1 Tax=Plantactinospora alkalitolerans TaxID=2789879 RepID=UPI001E46928F|nr:flagellar basal body protein FliL [Plantactinospora alkalitolerans]
MVNYGPPGGPYPGPPSEPWPDPTRQADDEYGQPADPWGDHDQPGGHGHWGGGQSSAPPAGPGSPVSYPGYQPTPQQPGGSVPFAAPPAAWTPPPSGSDPIWAPPAGDPNWSTSAPEPPPKGRRGRAFVGIVVALALMVVGGAAIGVYLFEGDQSTPETQPTSGPSTGPADQPTASAQPAPTSTAAEPSTDARFVKAGQCVANEGTEDAPSLAITICAPQTFEVLARYNGATTGATDAKAKCAKVQNYTNFYFFNSELDELDFVLCLRKR